jgi:DNA-binding MarR family transcriptional regulator
MTEDQLTQFKTDVVNLLIRYKEELSTISAPLNVDISHLRDIDIIQAAGSKNPLIELTTIAFKRAGMKQTEIAFLLGYTPGRVSQILKRYRD